MQKIAHDFLVMEASGEDGGYSVELGVVG